VFLNLELVFLLWLLERVDGIRDELKVSRSEIVFEKEVTVSCASVMYEC